MNNFSIKSHIPEGEDGFTLPSLDSSVSVTISFLNSLTALSPTKLINESGLQDSSNDGWPLKLFRLVSYLSCPDLSLSNINPYNL